ncbi:MAG TPA: transporter substrate-binding domain-containing protein [Geoalkalibacter subterraneus]|uniref:Transporter substrate-binding domain-containing protein n=1 Tax=Geoalkalibacter subterraneus TaxID=483547 RepID=A0A831LM01_9BACT|nr:transporter substrate-binding domain-containing protein [Geoalkalibacter subterraneus]
MVHIRNFLCFILFGFFLLAPAAIVVADELDHVRNDGVLRYAMSGQYPPFNFVDERNQLAGFDVEICDEIARRMDVEGRPVSTAWDGIVAGLLAKKYELICGSMAITQERLAAIDFSDPYYRSGAQLFVRRGSPLRTAEDLAGHTVGVTLGTTYEAWVRDNLPQVEVRTYKGVPAMILDVVNGRLDGFITDRIVGTLAIEDKGAPIDRAGGLLYEEQMGIALRQENPALKAAINKALDEMRQDGTYREISLKWLKLDAR